MAKENHNAAYKPLKSHAGDSVMNHVQLDRSWLGYEPLYQGRGFPIQEHKTCLNFFEDMVNQMPQAPALSMGGQTLTYAQVALSVNALAAWMIQDKHLRSGDRVALYLPNSLSYMIAVLASFKANLVVANLNSNLDEQDVLRQLQDSGAKVLITIPTYLPHVESMLLETSIRHIITTQADDFFNLFGRIKNLFSPAKWREKWQADHTVIRYMRLRQILKMRLDRFANWPVVHPRDMAVIQYTSGTMGQPKGVALSHANISANFQQTKHMLSAVVGPGCVGLCPVPLQHIIGFTFSLGMLSLGGHAILTTMAELLHRHKTLQHAQVDILLGMPFLYDQLLKKEQHWEWYKPIQLFLCGGGFTSRMLVKHWYEHTGQTLCEAYGLTEAGPLVAINPPQRIRTGSVGVVMPNTEICVVDPNMKALGFNEPGELWVRGPQVMRGYWHKPEETHKVMTYDDWFKTGDIVSVAEDGFMSMLERKKDTFWVHNQLILPHQVEQQINQHEDVLDCVLFKDDSQPTALIRLLVVAKQGLTVEGLRSFLKDQLHTIVIPDTIEFVDYLPKGPMGKVLRRVLRARNREGAAELTRLDKGAEGNKSE